MLSASYRPESSPFASGKYAMTGSQAAAHVDRLAGAACMRLKLIWLAERMPRALRNACTASSSLDRSCWGRTESGA